MEELDLKFWVSSKIGFNSFLDFGEGNQIKNTSDKKIAVVYQTWSTEKYIPYMYMSLIGQIMYTDVLDKADIYIFVDEERHEYVTWLFRNILDYSHIIKVSKMMAVKYMITTHPILQRYEIVSVVDSDMFFYAGDGNKHPMYEKISASFDENPKQTLMLVDNGVKASSVFWSRHANLCKSLNVTEYSTMIKESASLDDSKFENWMNENKWGVSCIFVYATSNFKDSAYFKHAITNAYHNQYCDETVWISWLKSNDLEYTDIRQLGINYLLSLKQTRFDAINRYGKLLLLHPLVGPERKNQLMLDILLETKAMFEKNYAGKNPLNISNSLPQ